MSRFTFGRIIGLFTVYTVEIGKTIADFNLRAKGNWDGPTNRKRLTLQYLNRRNLPSVAPVWESNRTVLLLRGCANDPQRLQAVIACDADLVRVTKAALHDKGAKSRFQAESAEPFAASGGLRICPKSGWIHLMIG